MSKKLRLAKLIQQLTSCKSLDELADAVKNINEFNKDYFIGETSDEYKKLDTVLSLMKIKLKRSHNDGDDNKKEYEISEDEDDDRSEDFFEYASIINAIENEVELDDEESVMNYQIELDNLADEISQNENLTETEKNHLFFMIDDVDELLNQ